MHSPRQSRSDLKILVTTQRIGRIALLTASTVFLSRRYVLYHYFRPRQDLFLFISVTGRCRWTNLCLDHIRSRCNHSHFHNFLLLFRALLMLAGELCLGKGTTAQSGWNLPAVFQGGFWKLRPRRSGLCR